MLLSPFYRRFITSDPLLSTDSPTPRPRFPFAGCQPSCAGQTIARLRSPHPPVVLRHRRNWWLHRPPLSPSSHCLVYASLQFSPPSGLVSPSPIGPAGGALAMPPGSLPPSSSPLAALVPCLPHPAPCCRLFCWGYGEDPLAVKVSCGRNAGAYVVETARQQPGDCSPSLSLRQLSAPPL